MMSDTAPPTQLVIASRESRLALWQAEHVRHALQTRYPACKVTILGVTTRGDRILDRTLSKVGGKGLFIKELENALADGRADLAVHSLKDVPMDLPPGFVLSAIMARDDPRDALVSPRCTSLDALPPQSVVGTSSLRREAMIRARHPQLRVAPLRGNVDTRLAKLDRGDYAAIILAAVGLRRLGLTARIACLFDPEVSLPAAGQGALGIETRADRPELAAWLAPLHHVPSALAAYAERAVSRVLGGTCEVPLAAYAAWDDEQLVLRGRVATLDGARVLEAVSRAAVTTPAAAAALGERVGAELGARGGHAIIRALLLQSGSVHDAAR